MLVVLTDEVKHAWHRQFNNAKGEYDEEQRKLVKRRKAARPSFKITCWEPIDATRRDYLKSTHRLVLAYLDLLEATGGAYVDALPFKDPELLSELFYRHLGGLVVLTAPFAEAAYYDSEWVHDQEKLLLLARVEFFRNKLRELQQSTNGDDHNTKIISDLNSAFTNVLGMGGTGSVSLQAGGRTTATYQVMGSPGGVVPPRLQSDTPASLGHPSVPTWLGHPSGPPSSSYHPYAGPPGSSVVDQHAQQPPPRSNYSSGTKRKVRFASGSPSVTTRPRYSPPFTPVDGGGGSAASRWDSSPGLPPPRRRSPTADNGVTFAGVAFAETETTTTTRKRPAASSNHRPDSDSDSPSAASWNRPSAVAFDRLPFGSPPAAAAACLPFSSPPAASAARLPFGSPLPPFGSPPAAAAARPRRRGATPKPRLDRPPPSAERPSLLHVDTNASVHSMPFSVRGCNSVNSPFQSSDDSDENISPGYGTGGGGGSDVYTFSNDSVKRSRTRKW